VRRFFTLNSLSIVFGLIFLGSLVGQAIAGHADYNSEQMAHHEAPLSFGRYLTSSQFGQAVMENWQSEYLQFALYIFGTVWLIQRGSPESKKPGEAGTESDEKQLAGEHAKSESPRSASATGLRRFVFENSLVLLMGAIFLGTLFADSACGWTVYNQEQASHHEAAISYWSYIRNADFWESALQNWQSEFLAIGSMAIFSVYLRQRGSPESKPVGASHDDATGSTG
jgi:hypothetical protein